MPLVLDQTLMAFLLVNTLVRLLGDKHDPSKAARSGERV